MHRHSQRHHRFYRRLFLEVLERRHVLAGTASISGLVWQDLDGDGAKGAAEPVFAGVSVYLDLNDNGAREGTEPLVATAADGSYSFTNLDAGNYVVRELVPANYRISSPQASGQRLFAVDTGASPDRIVELDLTTGAILRSMAAPLTSSTAVGLGFDGTTLYYLSNSNDTLYELNPNTGAVLDSTVLVSGSYGSLAVLGGKVYVLNTSTKIVAPFDPVTNTLGTGNDLDLLNQNFSIRDAMGQSATTGELLLATPDYVGLVNPATGVRTGSIAAATGSSVDSIEAIGNEIYVGNGSPNRLDVYNRSGTLFRTLNLTFVADETAGYADLSGANRLALAAGQAAANINLGDQYVLGSLQGTKWRDTNGNGVRDTGEPALPNYKIYLDLNDNSVRDGAEPTADTAADGSYVFSNVAAGSYVIRQVVTAPFQQTFPAFTTNRLFVYDEFQDKILELNPATGTTVNSFVVPHSGSIYNGLAFDGKSIFYLNNSDDVLYSLNPNTGALLKSIPLPSGSYEGLATLNGLVYVRNLSGGLITIVNPVTSTVVGTLTVKGYPSAYIYDGLGEMTAPDRLIGRTLFGEILLIDPVTGNASVTWAMQMDNPYGLTSVGDEIFAGDTNKQIEVYSRSGTLLRSFTNVPDAFSLGGAAGTYGAQRVKLSLGQTISGLDFASNEPAPPVAAGDSYPFTEDSPRTIAAAAGLLVNDADADTPLAGLSVVLDGSPPPAAAFMLAPNGSFSFAPLADSSLNVSFTYHVNDGALNSNTVTVTLTMQPANDAPVAVGESFSTTENSPLTVAVPGVLTNDFDIDSRVNDSTVSVAMNAGLTAVLDAPPAQGTLSLGSGGNFTYTPGVDVTDTVSFRYHVSDPQGATSSIATATINITPLPDPPRVVATSVAPGGVVAPGALTYTVTFSEPMNIGNLDAADYSLKGFLRAVNYSASTAAFSPDGTVLTLTYVGLPDDNYRLTLVSGSSGGTNFTDNSGKALDGEFSGVFPSGNGNVGGNFVIGFAMDVASEALPLPLTAESPLGSQIYDAGLARVIAFPGDTDRFTLAIDPGQTISVLVSPNSALVQPSVELKDPAGAVLATAAASAAGRSALLQTISTTTGGNYAITVSNVTSGAGLYTIKVYLNAAIEKASAGLGSNKSLATAQDLNATFSALPALQAGPSRAAIVGGLTAGSVTLSGIDSGWWDATGNRGVTGGASNKNYIVGLFGGVEYRNFAMFDLTGIDRPIASAQLALSNPANGFTSPDPTETYTLYDISTPLSSLAADGSGQVGIFSDLGTGLVLGSRDYSAADNNASPAIALNSDGLASLNASLGGLIALGGAVTTIVGTANQVVFSGSLSTFDNVAKQLVLDVPGPDRDFYSFTLTAGHSAAIGLKHLSGSGATIAIQDASGTTLATSAAGGNLDQAIGNFIAPATGTYYVVVGASASVKYSLLLTRDAALDAEPNDSLESAQNITNVAAVVGAIAASVGGSAGSAVVPDNLTNSEGPSSNNSPFSNSTQRYQQIYSASQFAAAGVIDAIRFRRDVSQGAFSTTGLNVQISLGYAAMSLAAPSSIFADNIGGGYVSVYNGPLTLSSNSSGSPRSFDVVIDVDNVFRYDPALGDLLLDIRVLSNASASFLLDASGVTQQSVTTRIRGSLNSLAGTVGFSNSNSPYGLITKFDLLALALEEDWYAIDVPDAVSTLQLQTSTPADGAGQFPNPLSPHLELYSPAGALLTAGTTLADGHNESLQYQLAAAGTYRVRLVGENDTAGECVLAKNLSPTAANLDVNTAEDTPAAATLPAADAEKQSLAYAIVTEPAHGTLSGIAPNLTYSPTKDYNGSDFFTYRANDGLLDSNLATVSISLSAVNDAPVANPESYSTTEDSLLTVAAAGVLANDTDAESPLAVLTASLASGPNSGTVTLGLDGSFTYLPSHNNTLSDSFTYRTLDPQGASSGLATVTIDIVAVNDAPEAVSDTLATTEDLFRAVLSPGVLANDTDVDTPPAGWVAVLDGTAPPATLFTLSPNGGFTFIPLQDSTISVSFTYHVNDGFLDSNQATVTITIQPVNDAPNAVGDMFNTTEDTPLVATAPGVLANDFDIDNRVNDSTVGVTMNAGLTVSLVTPPAAQSFTLSPNGAFTFVPLPDATQTVSFQYQVRDPQNATYGVATVTINITSTPDSPVAKNDDYSVFEDATLSVPRNGGTSGPSGVLSNDSDADIGDTITAHLASGPSFAQTFALGFDGSFTYVPSHNFFGTDSFSYRAIDNFGNPSGIAIATITVLGVPDPPEAFGDSYDVPHNKAITITPPGVLGNDADADGPPPPAAVFGSSLGLQGALSLGANGSFTYLPSTGFSSLTTFTYRAMDATALVSAFATVTLNVAANTPPLAVDDGPYDAAEDIARTIAAPGVLTNDFDFDGSSLSSALVFNTTPAAGTVSLGANGGFTYFPSANFNGLASFAYRASDGESIGNTVTVTIVVDAVNDSPIASGDSYSATEDILLVGAPGVLANDSDIENDPLQAVIDQNSPAAAGTVALGSDGFFTFTPSHDFSGTTSFTYHASDNSLPSGTVTVTLNVQPVNDPPSFLAGSDIATSDDSGSQSIAGWATSVSKGPPNESAQSLTFEIQSITNPGLFAVLPSIDASGQLNFTAAPNVEGLASVTLVLHDGGGAANGGQDSSDPQTFTIDIAKPHRWHNQMAPLTPIDRGAMEVLFEDEDHSITPTDVLVIINYLNSGLPAKIPLSAAIANGTTQPFYDVDGDDSVTPTDALLVINLLNASQGGPAGGEGEGAWQQPFAAPPPFQGALADLLSLLAADSAEQEARKRRGR